MKKIFTLLAFIFVITANAQETQSPDYTLIDKEINNSSSPYYYAALYSRYAKADTSMTLEERRHLYYGFAFSKKNNHATKVQNNPNLIKGVLQKTNPTVADLENVVNYTTALLEVNPFSLTIKQYRMYCLKELGRYKEANIERAQSDIIIDAILSSGDGTTQQNSIHVVDIDNEYEVVSLMGFEPVDSENEINGKYDYFILNKNMYNLQGLYFEVADAKNMVTGL